MAELKIRDLQMRLHGRKSERRAEEEAKDQAELGIEVPEAVTVQEPKEEPAKAVARPRQPRASPAGEAGADRNQAGAGGKDLPGLRP